MKASIIEHGTIFELVVEPETQDELALVIRLGINATKKKIDLSSYVYKDLTAMLHMVISKRTRAISNIVGGKP
jgi:hypothetical protein